MSYITYENAKLNNLEIISDNFESKTGEWDNYYAHGTDSSSAAIISNLNKQKHTDIRNFKSRSSPVRMIDLSSKKVETITSEVQNLGISTSSNSQNWYVGTTLVPLSTDATTGWNELRYTLTGSQITIESSTESVIDLSSYATNDIVSVSLPDLPALTFASSSFYLKDANNVTKSFFFSSYGASASGDQELSISVSLLSGDNFDKSKIKTVGFVLNGSNGLVFKCRAIRCLSSNWKLAQLDFDTIEQTVCKPVPRKGDSAGSDVVFPTANSGSLDSSTSWPVLIKSFSPGLAEEDPKVVNGEMSSVVFTGNFASATDADPNEFSFYFRIAPKYYTQETYNSGTKPKGLNGKTVGSISTVAPESLTNLNINTAAPNLNYLKISLIWYLSNNLPIFKIQIKNSYNNNILFDIPLNQTINNLIKNQKIVFNVLVNENFVNIKIYKKNINNNTFNLIYNSQQIFSTQFYKQRGRIGWKAKLTNGDSYIEKIHSQGFIYAEYETVPMTSITPVKGAQLFTDASKPVELFNYPLKNSFTSWNNSATTTSDIDKNKPATSTRVTSFAGKGVQGIQTSEFKIENFKDIKISLKLWFPKIDATVLFLLYNVQDDTYVTLTTPYFIKGQWNKLNLQFESNFVIAGNYKLIILQTAYNLNATWWVSEPQITQNQISWQARSKSGGPASIDAEDWIDFGPAADLINGSVLFSKFGKELQIKGSAKSQHAVIKSVKINPMYATLGNIVWRD